MSAVTAHVGYEPSRGAFGRAREVYHAVLDEAARVGWVTRQPGQPLCGSTATLADCPPGLFAPQVTCPACVAALGREHITLAGAA